MNSKKFSKESQYIIKESNCKKEYKILNPYKSSLPEIYLDYVDCLNDCLEKEVKKFKTEQKKPK